MRAATAIVGATAVSSCLIALAFLLSSNGGSSKSEKPAPSAAPRTTEATSSQTPSEAGRALAGELRQCGSGEASISVEGTSCEFGEEIQQAYKSGSSETLAATDPESGETITVTCTGTAPVICTGAGGVSVYFAD